MLQNSVRPAGVPLIRDSRKNDFPSQGISGLPGRPRRPRSLEFSLVCLLRSHSIAVSGFQGSPRGLVRRARRYYTPNDRSHRRGKPSSQILHISARQQRLWSRGHYSAAAPGPPAGPAGRGRSGREGGGGGPERERAAAPGPGWGPGAAAWGRPGGRGGRRKMPVVGQRRPALPRAYPAVPSALGGLTSGFGMGPGVPPLPWSLTNDGHSAVRAVP